MKVRCVKSVLVMLAMGMIAACGGGGGSTTNNSSSNPPSNYSGVTTQATVTTSNATALSSDAYENGGTGPTASIAGVEVQAANLTSSPQSLLPDVGAALKSSIARAIDQQTSLSPSAVGVMVSKTIPGYSGSASTSGSATYDITYDQNGSFSGTMTYNNYIATAGGPSIQGSVTFSGSYNTASGTFNSMTITFSSLTATTSTGTETLNGSISYSTSGSTETLTVSCTVQKGGQTYWVKNWTYTYTSTNTLTITGRYYHPTYGYVDVTTETPLTVSSIDGRPTSGILLFTGSNGTKARITFTSTGYTVAVYDTANGQYVTLQ